MNKVTVICNEPHVVTTGVCAFCERDRHARLSEELAEIVRSLTVILEYHASQHPVNQHALAFLEAHGLLGKEERTPKEGS